MQDFLGNSTALYFYSTVFQGNMALLALVGVFAIYKLQEINRSIDDNRITMIENVNRFVTQPILLKAFFGDMKRLIERIDSFATVNEQPSETILEIKKLKQSPSYQFCLFNYEENVKFKNSIIDRMKTPFYFTLAVIILSLIILPFSVSIHNYSKFIEILLIVWIISLNIVSLYLNERYIINVLNDNVRFEPEKKE